MEPSTWVPEMSPIELTALDATLLSFSLILIKGHFREVVFKLHVLAYCVDGLV